MIIAARFRGLLELRNDLCNGSNPFWGGFMVACRQHRFRQGGNGRRAGVIGGGWIGFSVTGYYIHGTGFLVVDYLWSSGLGGICNCDGKGISFWYWDWNCIWVPRLLAVIRALHTQTKIAEHNTQAGALQGCPKFVESHRHTLSTSNFIANYISSRNIEQDEDWKRKKNKNLVKMFELLRKSKEKSRCRRLEHKHTPNEESRLNI